jgi:hypothetical protein
VNSLTPYLERLRLELAEIRADMDDLIAQSTILNVNPNSDDSPVFFVGAADWGWAPSDAQTTAAQMRLSARYSAWFDRFTLLLPHPTPAVDEKLKRVDEFVRRWAARPATWDYTVPATIELARQRAAAEFTTFDELLEIAAKNSTETLRLIPDTNALIRNPDIASYSRTAPSETFVVHLVPTVLGELDDLKDRGKTQELRDRAQGVVRRLKGLRDKGDLATGVRLTKAVTVKTEAREVNVREVLGWLDPAVPDDRLLACALRLQSDHPAGSVVLVTSDLNLQNKADAVGMPYLETPPTVESLRAALVASIDWPTEGTGPPAVTLSNKGPAVARTIEYSVTTLPDTGPPHFRAGPWSRDRLKPGEHDQRDVYGFYAPVILVNATWSDDDGVHELSWSIDFPDRTRPP